MGSRKENLKKSLGISEYPWSSDEEENNTAQPVQVARRQSDEARPSVAAIPGTSGGNGGNTSSNPDDSWWRESSGSQPVRPASGGSGTQQTHPSSPATARRQQANMDRALFWSIINNTPRPSNDGVSRSRPGDDVPLTYVTRPALASRTIREMTQRRDRIRTAAEIQRVLAFEKMTRNLQNITSRQQKLKQTISRRRDSQSLELNQDRDGAWDLRTRQTQKDSHLRPARCLAHMTGSSRSPLFTPSMSAAATPNARSRTNCCSRYHPTRSSMPPGCTRNVNPPDVLPVGDSQPSSSGRYRSEARSAPPAEVDTSPPASEPHHYVNVDQSDEDVEAVLDSAPAAEQTDDNNAEEENNESAPHEPGGALSLEEVMEVDAPDEPDVAAPADVETDATEPNVSNETNAVATNTNENADTAQQSPFHGVKRKRDATDENAEPYSVQEFNQSLLRLLECPVCLEWMEPPISQCRRGHLVCSRCRTRLASCPVCRTTFSSVRNRAMEGVAEMLRYPCRHGCGREVRLRRRAPHEASCGARRYHCPVQPCARHPPLAHHELAHHFQCKHLPIVKIGRKHKFSMKVNSEQHDTWLIMAMDEYFHLRVDVDIRTWGVIVYVAYIGPKRKAKHYTYEVTVEGQHNCRSLKYARATHSDLESSSLNVSRQDCFHLTLDQALNFLRFKNRHCEPDKFLDFDVEIGKCHSANAQESKDESDS